MGKLAKDALFSRVRRDVLGTILLHPQKTWYLSQLVRHLGAAPSHLHRELGSLVEAGILIRRVEGRQTYFQANAACPFLPDLTGLLRKMIGAPAVLTDALGSVRSKNPAVPSSTAPWHGAPRKRQAILISWSSEKRPFQTCFQASAGPNTLWAGPSIRWSILRVNLPKVQRRASFYP